MSYLYNIKRPKDLKITYKKDNISLNKKLYNNFNNNLLKKNNIIKNKFIPILFDSDINFELIKILLNKYKFNDEDIINNNNLLNNTKKYNKIIYSNKIKKFKDIKYCNIEKDTIDNKLKNILQIFDIFSLI
jgi:hypothetical protein